jgi:hypothetical protein
MTQGYSIHIIDPVLEGGLYKFTLRATDADGDVLQIIEAVIFQKDYETLSTSPPWWQFVLDESAQPGMLDVNAEIPAAMVEPGAYLGRATVTDNRGRPVPIFFALRFDAPPAPTAELVILNIMGQEDLYRDIDGTRADNKLDGRIVFTTTTPAWGVFRYGQVGIEGLAREYVFSTPAMYHEYFVDNLNPGAEYVFQIEAWAEPVEEGGPEQYIITGLHYFLVVTDEIIRSIPPAYITLGTGLIAVVHPAANLLATESEAAYTFLPPVTLVFDLAVGHDAISTVHAAPNTLGLSTDTEIV